MKGTVKAKHLNVLMMPFDKTNPYQTNLCTALSKLGVDCFPSRPEWKIKQIVKKKSIDVIHIHWLQNWATGLSWIKFPVGYLWFTMGLKWFQKNGGRVVWTVHNIEDHENRALVRERYLAQWLATNANCIIAHSRAASSEIARKFEADKSKIAVIPHGTYGGHYPNNVSKEKALQLLGLDTKIPVILFFGNIRRYKGIDKLIKAFSDLPENTAILVIAGRVLDEEYFIELKNIMNSTSNIVLHNHYIPDHEIQYYFRASRIVVFPYRKSLTSGAVVLAMSFGKTCLAPERPTMRETLCNRDEQFFNLDKENDLSNSLNKLLHLDEAELNKIGLENLNKSSKWSWDAVAEQTLNTYKG